jgi:hypothetical protein
VFNNGTARMMQPQHCHPEQSKAMSEANRFAQSRDLAFQSVLGNYYSET